VFCVRVDGIGRSHVNLNNPGTERNLQPVLTHLWEVIVIDHTEESGILETRFLETCRG
jgi:hypothetical protein